MMIKKLLKIIVVVAGLLIILTGCQQTAGPAAIDTVASINERHANTFGSFDLPRKIGSVENVGLELPRISPDGKMMLYLRTDCEQLSPMTLLGSPDPNDTSVEGTLAVWLRPVQGNSAGRAISTARWAHSAVWSPDNRAVAYVVNEPPVSWIEHVDLENGTRTRLGQKGMINCLPRFDADSRTLLFCATNNISDPFSIYRQALDQGEPTLVSPQGMDCLMPVLQQDDRRIICASSQNDQLRWVAANSQGITSLADRCGGFDRSMILQTWAGVIDPISPDRQNFLFYDTLQCRICVYHRPEKFVRFHRSDSIAACWLDDQAIALATVDRVFLVNTQTGMSLELFNGSWIPARYVSVERKLILFERENSRRFSIMEIQFHDRINETTTKGRGSKQ
jgi:hypothetical protein